MAQVLVAGDGVEPGAQIGGLGEAAGVLRHSEPGLLEEVLGQVLAPAQPEEERVDAHVVARIRPVEGGSLATAQAGDDVGVVFEGGLSPRTRIRESAWARQGSAPLS